MIDRTREKEELVERIAQEKGLAPYWMSSETTDEKFPLKQYIKMSVEQWLRSFDDAKFVLTDSFHGCVFSIIYKKQFLAVGNKKRGLSRFDSFLTLFSLQDQLILSSDKYKNNLSLINYDQEQGHLRFFQDRSFVFLKTIFNK